MASLVSPTLKEPLSLATIWMKDQGDSLDETGGGFDREVAGSKGPPALTGAEERGGDVKDVSVYLDSVWAELPAGVWWWVTG